MRSAGTSILTVWQELIMTKAGANLLYFAADFSRFFKACKFAANLHCKSASANNTVRPTAVSMAHYLLRGKK